MTTAQTAGLTLRDHKVVSTRYPDGTIRLGSGYALGDVVPHTGVWLHRWAEEAPSRVFLAERAGAGWREHGYGEVLGMVRAIASSLSLLLA